MLGANPIRKLGNYNSHEIPIFHIFMNEQEIFFDLSIIVNKPFGIRCVEVFLTMEKTDYLAVVKFFVLEGLSPTAIHTNMMSMLGESAFSFQSLYRSVLEFKRDRTCVEDDPRTGRSKSRTPEII